VLGIPARGQKLAPNPWWEKSPKKIKFYQNRVNRSVNEVYHFLLPDKSMLGVRTIKEQKQANTEADKAMKNCADGWIAPISQTDFRTLQRISGKIDVLLKEYFTDQLSIDKYTRNKGDVWGLRDNSESGSLFANAERVENYANKQRLFDTRYRHDNAYHKLKLVMDYWCALWFWEYKDASSLPTREQYWADIEAMLDVDNDKLDTKTRQAMERHGMNDLFDNVDLEDEGRTLTEEESAILVRSKRELLLGTKGQGQTLNLFEEPERFKIVQRLSDRYHFFHPMLEFIEVFWLRDGFDVICGNPPWIKLEFNEANVISEKYPEIAIRNTSAPDVHKIKDEFLKSEGLKDLFIDEQIECECSAVFLNAYVNYPLLSGQQTDLYKCILVNSLDLMSGTGYMGMIHPESVYDDPNGGKLRKTLYHRLRYHFQYQNALNLFAIAHRRKYGSNIYGGYQDNIAFDCVNNIFHPATIDASYIHDGHGVCKGIKDEETGKWNLAGHKDRIIHYNDEYIRLLSTAFEDGQADDCAKLVSIHNKTILDVLDKIALYRTTATIYSPIITECLHETGAPNAGIIERNTYFPDVNKYEMVYNAPHFYVGNPYYKTPRAQCKNKGDYDTLDIQTLEENFSPRSNYRPLYSISDYKDLFKGFQCGQDDEGKPIYDDWIDYYKVGFRKMINQAGERSLICAVLPRRTAHIHGVISVTYRDGYNTVDMAALCASIIMDFYLKTIAAQNLTANRLLPFPVGVAPKYQSALYSRTLLLNCLTKHYADLWEECWRDEYAKEQWSITDSRLKPFNGLERKWSWNTPLRNYFERRQALVEIDVIAAMALGLSLKDLELIYRIQFPVLQQNENDTWYDTKGNIVFTCSRGLTGVGVDRPVWNTIREMKPGETYVHTIEKSELYKGQQVTYYAPFTRCDRIEDYRRAWAHFEPIFNK
jgi:hypothetical protein